MATALASMMSLPSARLAPHRTPLDRLVRLEAALGPKCPPLYIKRDDLLPFGGGGNKVRKADVLVSDALASGADTLITCGALQSNHARVTAAAGAACGLRVILILNGDKPDRPTGNLRLDQLFGAQIRIVPTRGIREHMDAPSTPWSPVANTPPPRSIHSARTLSSPSRRCRRT